MHNLFLGTGKHMVEVWLTNDFLSRRNMEDTERLVNQFIIPEGIGRVPSKIALVDLLLINGKIGSLLIHPSYYGNNWIHSIGIVGYCLCKV